jgi:hypothetical protein
MIKKIELLDEKVCVCVCVRKRERERERKSRKETQGNNRNADQICFYVKAARGQRGGGWDGSDL